MYEELIERLREYPDREETAGGYVEIDWQDLLDAADAIELLTDQFTALQTENAELKKLVEAKEAILRLYEPTLSLVSGDKNTAIHRMRKSEVTLSRMKAERDAAIADISHVCPTCGQFQGGDCPVLFYKDYPKDCEHWRWRGVQGEG